MGSVPVIEISTLDPSISAGLVRIGAVVNYVIAVHET
jgi:hypothetical protein